MTLWFGEPWPSAELRAPVCEDDNRRIPVPVGGVCYLCDELIDDTDRGVAIPSVVTDKATGEPMPSQLVHSHIECHLRSVLGCSGHLLGQGHTHDISYREDARRVVRWLEDRPVV